MRSAPRFDWKTEEQRWFASRIFPERTSQTGIGDVGVRMPKVRDRSGGGIVFNSALLPPYLKRAKNVEEFLPWLYLKGISTVGWLTTITLPHERQLHFPVGGSRKRRRG